VILQDGEAGRVGRVGDHGQAAAGDRAGHQRALQLTQIFAGALPFVFMVFATMGSSTSTRVSRHGFRRFCTRTELQA
jgi:hypothetical protein